MKVIVRLKNKDKVNDLERYGNIVYRSLVLNIVGLEIAGKHYKEVKNHPNVLSCEIESEGKLMLV